VKPSNVDGVESHDKRVVPAAWSVKQVPIAATLLSRPVQVALINDYPIVVAGLATLLEPYAARVHVRRSTTSVAELGQMDVVLFDTFGKADVWTRLTEILAVSHAKVLVFSWAPTPDKYAGYVSLGASGYLSKGASAEEVVDAIEAVACGGNLLAVRDTAEGDAGSWPGKSTGLSAREAEILALIVAGLTNQEIAERLYLSVNTVKTYIRTAYRKMSVTTRTRAVIWGVQHGFHKSR
jgi:NarL family two-component system response regulator LiaR